MTISAGASVVAPGDDAAIVASGSEVEVALAARELLADHDVRARVVSMPSWELFRQRSRQERAQVLPPGMPSVAVEAGSPQGWRELVDEAIGLDRFGASAPASVLYREFGLTPDRVAAAVQVRLSHQTT